MGIRYYPKVIYGITFSYIEACKIREYPKFEQIRLETNSKEDNLIWTSDLYYSKILSFELAYPYPGASDNPSHCEYYVGLNLTDKPLDFIRNLDTETLNKKIKNLCKKFKLPYENKAIQLYYTVHIC